MTARRDRFFLGGRDLEMEEIRRLLEEHGRGAMIRDKGLAWGAKASDYSGAIEASLAAGERPVLIELADDLPPGLDRGRLLFIDHHGERAGADRPSALRQVFDLIGAPQTAWSRHRQLVAANDIGHIAGMRRLGATGEEVRAIRDADRAAQGIGRTVEEASRAALARRREAGALAVIPLAVDTASALMDFLARDYGGDEPDNVFVLMPGKFAFFGRGDIILSLASYPGSWFGGSLPERGYWGAPRPQGDDGGELIARISAGLAAARHRPAGG